MVKHDARSLDVTFAALSDATRRAILVALASGDAAVTELASPHKMTLPAVMKHLRVLESAGLLRKEKRGRTVWCQLDPAPLKDVADWVTRYREFWEAQFDALAGYLEGPEHKEEDACPAVIPKSSKRFGSAASSPPRRRKSSAHGRTRKN